MVNIIRFAIGIVIMICWTQHIKADFLDEGLVGHYEFECNTEDSGQSGATLIEYGDPQCVDEGQLLRGYKFDGDDALIFPSNTSAPYYSTSGFTWSVWINADSLPNANASGIGMPLISFADPRDGRDAYLGFGSPYTNRRELTFLVDGAGGAGGSAFLLDGICKYYPPTGFEDSTWLHIAGVRDYDNNTISLYLDGALVSTKSFQVDEPLSDNNPGAIAGYTEGGDPTAFFSGVIDEVRFYQKPFSEEDVLKLYSLKPDQLRTDLEQINFGELVCQPDSTIALEVFNFGPSSFDITEIKFSEGSVFSFTDPSPLTLTYPEGDTLSLEITFTPLLSQSYTDTIYFFNDLDFPPLAIPLKGSRLAFETDTIDLGANLICDNGYLLDTTLIFQSILGGETRTISNFTTALENLVIDKTTGDVLGDSSLDSINFTIQPDGNTIIDDLITITFEDCPLQKHIRLIAEFVEDSALVKPIEYGLIPEGAEIDTVIKIIYPPLAKSVYGGIRVTGVNLVPENDTTITINEIVEGSKFLISGDTIMVSISGVINIGMSLSILELQLETPCGSKSITNPILTIPQYVASGHIEPSDIEYSSYGEQVDVKVSLSELKSITQSTITELSFDLNWNGSTLTAPETVELNVEDDYWVKSNFTINATALTEGEILLFRGVTTLGNTAKDSIWITNITAKGGYYEFDSAKGELALVGEFSNSDFLLFKRPGITLTIAPNPIIDNTVSFSLENLEQWELSEDVEYSILDLLGKVQQEGTIKTSDSAILTDIQPLPGSYFLRLQFMKDNNEPILLLQSFVVTSN